MASGCSVRLPVAAAAGSVTPFEEKYALNGQPRAHWLRPWHGPRPLCSRDSTAVALQMSLRSPLNFAAMWPRMCFSSAFISNGGCRTCSGNCGSPEFSPLAPMKRSTCSYQGAMSA